MSARSHQAESELHHSRVSEVKLPPTEFPMLADRQDEDPFGVDHFDFLDFLDPEIHGAFDENNLKMGAENLLAKLVFAQEDLVLRRV